MVQVISDNEATAATLQQLVSRVRQAGGWINDDIILRCDRGALSVHLQPQATAADNLLLLPPECLIPIEQVTLGLDGDRLTIVSRAPGLAPPRQALLETMVTLFNRTGKVKTHRLTSPWLLGSSSPELFRVLLSGRSPQLYQELLDHLGKADGTEQLIIQSLLKTRVIGFTTRQDSDRRTQMLMPVADLVNHSPLAPTYTNYVDRHGDSRLAIKIFCGDPASRECHVRYGYYDALDLYLVYGYLDTGTLFVRSIPLDIELADSGTLRIRSLCHHPAGRKLPPQIADLDVYLPNFTVDRSAKCAEAGFLLIPQDQAPHALRRVLAVMLQNLDPALDPPRLKQRVELAEAQILDANRAYYQRLLELAAPPPDAGREDRLPLELASDMAGLQLAKLAAYPLA